MWPIGGILKGANNSLRVPGQDSPATWTAFAGWPDAATSGVYINVGTLGLTVNGSLARRQNSSYFPQTNQWIHSDVRSQIDRADYEFRFVNVTGDTGQLLGSDFEGTSYGAEDGWISGDLDPRWYLVATGPQFGTNFLSVNGIIQAREKANTSNIVSGDLTIAANYEGEQ